MLRLEAEVALGDDDRGGGLEQGDPAARLDVRDEDLISEKTRFSALVQGSSDLHDRLQTRGIENVLVGGTLTNMCCESTARDAMMMTR